VSDVARRLWPAWLAIALALSAWAGAFVGIRAAVTRHGFSPAPLALGRYLVAALVLALLCLPRRPPAPRIADLPRLLLMGLVGIGAYNLACNLGLQTVPAGTASFIINAVGPIGAALGAALILREPVRPRLWIALALTVVGLALIAVGRDGRIGGVGLSWAFAAGACAAIFVVSQKPLLPRYGALGATAWAVWLGCLPLLPWTPQLCRELAGAGPAAWGLLLFLGVVPAALAYGAWAWASTRLPVSRAAPWLATIPVQAVLLGWFCLGELPAGLSLAGGALVLAAVAWGTRPVGNRHPTPPVEGAWRDEPCTASSPDSPPSR